MNFSVVVPYRPNKDRALLWEWIRARWESLYPDCEIIEVDAGEEEFHRGASRNLGVSKATNSLIVLADADTPPIKQYLDLALKQAKSNPWVISYGSSGYHNAGKDYTFELLKQNPNVDIREPEPSECEHHGLQSWAGMLIMRKDHFVSYDERFMGWGYEDDAFRDSMNTINGAYVRIEDGYIVHLWHPRSEQENFGQPNIEKNRRLARNYKQAASKRDNVTVRKMLDNGKQI